MPSNISYTPQENKKSKLLMRYQKLIKDIENKKRQQENLNEGMTKALPKIHAELLPLVGIQTDLHIQRLARLDEIFEDIKLSANQSNMFVDYMVEELESLNDTYSGGQREVLDVLLEKYAEGDCYEGDEYIDYHQLAAEIEENTECEVDVEELKEKGFEQYMADHRERFMSGSAMEDAEGFFGRESDFDFFGDFANEPKKKKSKKQTKREIQEEEENKMLALDAKAIYIRLIKKYHPDRQQDETLKLEYTEISKNVTKAYQENDFMALLQLQIMFLEESETDATMLADDMLKRYNKILQAQLNELSHELERAKYSTNSFFEDFFDKDCSFSERLFEKKKKEICLENEIIKIELEDSYKQKKGWFKEVLKEIKHQKEMQENMFFFDNMMP